MLSTVSLNFDADGAVQPVVLFLHSTGDKIEMGVVPIISMGTGDEKDMLSDAVKSLCKKLDVIALMFISEAYMATVDRRDVDTVVRGGLSNMENKVEVVLATFETPFSSQMYSGEIMRDKKSPYMLPFKGPSTTAEGRFSHLLAKRLIAN